MTCQHSSYYPNKYDGVNLQYHGFAIITRTQKPRQKKERNIKCYCSSAGALEAHDLEAFKFGSELGFFEFKIYLFLYNQKPIRVETCNARSQLPNIQC